MQLDKVHPTTHFAQNRLLDSTAFKRFWDGACKTAFCEEDRELLFLTAAVVPFRDLTYVEKSKRHFVSKDVVLHSLKLSMHDADVSSAVLANIENVQRHVNKHAKTPGGLDRKTLGMCQMPHAVDVKIVFTNV